jgi:hypothetical protein
MPSKTHEEEPTVCCNPWGWEACVGNDADLANHMNQLSVEEREKDFSLHDVHCVAKVKEETPEFVEEHIRALDTCIAAIPPKQRNAFNRASFLWPKLKTDTKFKLMFLRADHYDAQKTVRRMAKRYGQNRSLFGEDKNVKRVTMDALKTKMTCKSSRQECWQNFR